MMRVFLDATCWVAAAGSRSGGSARIIQLAIDGRLKLLTTLQILQETEANIPRLKDPGEALLRFRDSLTSLGGALDVINAPTPDEERRWLGLTAEKDLHV